MYLTKKYRLIWDINTLDIENDPSKDNSGTTSIVILNENMDYFESDNYQDILDKILEENLNLSE